MSGYRETTREFATGDRIQFTAPEKNLGVANRDLGTIISLEDAKIAVRLDGKEGCAVTFDPNEYRQFDHSYAVTSHSSQGLTAGRVIVNIEFTQLGGEDHVTCLAARSVADRADSLQAREREVIAERA